MTGAGGSAELTVELVDRYRGLAFFLYRVLMLRREMRDIESWLKTGGNRTHPDCWSAR